jgi:N-dimethylarginine dimethylaminohydrolase
MNTVMIVNPPKNCWANGYPICKGNDRYSINKTTIYSQKNNIVANQNRLKKSFNKLKKTLKISGYNLNILPFPQKLDSNDCINHDGVFIRDVGLMFKNYWIKANFSAKNRQIESDVYSKIISKKYGKKIISLPDKSYLEFGEVYYLNTSDKTYYFGGLSRSNKKGHDFVKKIIKPDHYCLIKSRGYHLDTVFAPVLNKENKLIAIIVAKDMLKKESYNQLKKLGVKIININDKDSSGINGLGNYAVNCLVGRGVLISGSKFSTPNVEEKLKKLGIKHYIVSLTDYNYSGGSAHCLTNEVR